MVCGCMEQSQYFTLRVWVEEMGNGRTEFRGTLKHVLSGETCNFRDWDTLLRLIELFVVPTKVEKKWGNSL